MSDTISALQNTINEQAATIANLTTKINALESTINNHNNKMECLKYVLNCMKIFTSSSELTSESKRKLNAIFGTDKGESANQIWVSDYSFYV